jgi:thiamine pyrophosphate-dependent acetolactate synthase large subunit-like protein
MTIKLTGAQIIIKALQEEGVDTIFGYPGGAIIDLYDQLVKTDIRHIMVRHEQGAVHAADGYARAAGKVGVCLVTSGPGATNTVSGIASAYMDSIPIVVLTGQVPTSLIGNDAFQETLHQAQLPCKERGRSRKGHQGGFSHCPIRTAGPCAGGPAKRPFEGYNPVQASQ